MQLNSGSDPDGSAIALVPYTFVSPGKSNLKLTITDGSITSREGVAISVCNPRTKVKEEIIDGSAAIEIYGGTYSNDVSSFCDKDHVSIKEGADAKSFTVVPGEEDDSVKDHIAVARIGNKYYGSVGAAIDAIHQSEA
ncbi:hypothetical protein GMI69_08370 [Eggerthellaceae bacterium zg-887]|uniref:hypothetical protein n=1 Tax=Xiamenia xianingshaonis TaxID=2682776 RepID=UPI00140ABF80|nr:hypothetical protein [Xiamenia xianingshaonis]NHM16667.1 hypothetical protein [Xiamenia xianingshaonis]